MFILIYPLDRCQHVDSRTRRDRIKQRNDGFKHQLKVIIDAYITWQDIIGEEGLDAGHPVVAAELLQGLYKVQAVNVYCEYSPFSSSAVC